MASASSSSDASRPTHTNVQAPRKGPGKVRERSRRGLADPHEGAGAAVDQADRLGLQHPLLRPAARAVQPLHALEAAAARPHPPHRRPVARLRDGASRTCRGRVVVISPPPPLLERPVGRVSDMCMDVSWTGCPAASRRPACSDRISADRAISLSFSSGSGDARPKPSSDCLQTCVRGRVADVSQAHVRPTPTSKDCQNSAGSDASATTSTRPESAPANRSATAAAAARTSGELCEPSH